MEKRTSKRLNIRAHMSISGGVDRAPVRGKQVGCEAIQIFTKSNMQWKARELSDDEVERFKKSCEENDIGSVVAHDCYLINLGSPDKELYRKSCDSFLMEIRHSY